MAENFEFKGYTIITSLSHGLLGPLKLSLDRMGQLISSPKAFLGEGAVLGGFPAPNRVILAPGCMEEALFDEHLHEEDKDYRAIFGDRVMLEVQGYVRKIPAEQVRFRQDPDAVGDVEESVARILEAFAALGVEVGAGERESLQEHLG